MEYLLSVAKRTRDRRDIRDSGDSGDSGGSGTTGRRDSLKNTGVLRRSRPFSGVLSRALLSAVANTRYITHRTKKTFQILESLLVPRIGLVR